MINAERNKKVKNKHTKLEPCGPLGTDVQVSLFCLFSLVIISFNGNIIIIFVIRAKIIVF